MKNLFSYIITATALLSIPEFNFCQTTSSVKTTSALGVSGNVRFKDDLLQFTGNTGTGAAFTTAPAEINNAATTPVTSTATEQCFADGQCYGAAVDNKRFEIRNYYPFTVALVAQPSSMDGAAPAKTIISIIMDGNSYKASDGSTFDETIQLDLVLAAPMTPDPKSYSVSLQHNSTVYSMVKGDASNVTVTDFIWSKDGKSFNMSINFNCTMRSWASATTGKGDVNLKGKMSRIHVTVPGWITACK